MAQVGIEEIAAEDGTITDWQTVTLVNRGSAPFTIEYAMQKYIVPADGSLEAGRFAVVPYHAFVLYCGDPRSFDVPGDDRQRYRSDEWKRLRTRYGVYDDVNNPGAMAQIPTLEAYNIHGTRIITVLEDPDGTQTNPEKATTSQTSQLAEQNRLLQAQMANVQKQLDGLLAQQRSVEAQVTAVNPNAISDDVDPEDRRDDSDADLIFSADDETGDDEIPDDNPTSSNVKFS